MEVHLRDIRALALGFKHHLDGMPLLDHRIPGRATRPLQHSFVAIHFAQRRPGRRSDSMPPMACASLRATGKGRHDRSPGPAHRPRHGRMPTRRLRPTPPGSPHARLCGAGGRSTRPWRICRGAPLLRLDRIGGCPRGVPLVEAPAARKHRFGVLGVSMGGAAAVIGRSGTCAGRCPGVAGRVHDHAREP